MLNDILSIYSQNEESLKIEKEQILHRLKLIDFWGIKAGDKVLEIGCGQGDTTVALASVVSKGKDGFVTAVDIANESYGSPETIGQAKERIMNSKFGNNVSIMLNYDIMKNADDFKDDEFDCVVLSHCLWYFPDYDFLDKIIKKVKRLAKRLCVAEWNPHIDNENQFAHFRAAEIQAICECFREDSDSNIKTMFFPRDIQNSVITAGYDVDKFEVINSPEVYDAEWEVQMTISAYPRIIRNLQSMPEQLKEHLLSQIFDLRLSKDFKPMSSLVIKAVRIE